MYQLSSAKTFAVSIICLGGLTLPVTSHSQEFANEIELVLTGFEYCDTQTQSPKASFRVLVGQEGNSGRTLTFADVDRIQVEYVTTVATAEADEQGRQIERSGSSSAAVMSRQTTGSSLPISSSYDLLDLAPIPSGGYDRIGLRLTAFDRDNNRIGRSLASLDISRIMEPPLPEFVYQGTRSRDDGALLNGWYLSEERIVGGGREVRWVLDARVKNVETFSLGGERRSSLKIPALPDGSSRDPEQYLPTYTLAYNTAGYYNFRLSPRRETLGDLEFHMNLSPDDTINRQTFISRVEPIPTLIGTTVPLTLRGPGADTARCSRPGPGVSNTLRVDVPFIDYVSR